MSSPMIRSGECRKFAPNIFNKTKCTNCFRQKEEHSAEALESNRATRKVAKCGYLFVAPGWDFTNPLNRTKRWQRRWFVLYDDGELSYSLDEHPETVPQASIDMNVVVEVRDAEEVTGNAYSLSIAAPDRMHFVKGTCREEARWWSDVLSVFPRSKGRHKRNATFPGSQTPAPSSAALIQPASLKPAVRSTEVVSSWPVWEGDDVFPTRDVPPPLQPVTAPVETPPPAPVISSPVTAAPLDTRKVYMGSPPTRDKVRCEDKTRSRRVQNREKRGLKTGRSFSEDLTKMIPTWHDTKNSSAGQIEVSRHLLMEEFESECKLKDIADTITRPRLHSPPTPPSTPSSLEPTRDSEASHKQERGDPDGCGLDMGGHRGGGGGGSELRLELPAEELLMNMKKGWLMKQQGGGGGQSQGEWTKHWFVLRGSALLYYRDPGAEDQGILDGVIDLSAVSGVHEVQVARNYGFHATTWDDRCYVLSAVTAGIRNNWMAAVRRAAGLLEEKSDPSATNHLHSIQQQDREVIVPTGRSLLFSSDEEYRTASEGGRRESEDWGDALPPSPPLNRTPISRVKERARGRVYSTSSKRSRSSPPSSRRSTLDSIRAEDYVLACCNLSPTDPLDRVDIGLADPDSDMKQQLGRALRELSSAQEELLRAKKRDLEMAQLGRRVDEMVQRLEDANKQRSRDETQLDHLHQRIVDEKREWEAALHLAEDDLCAARERCAGLCAELRESAALVERLRGEGAGLAGRLAAGIEENEALYRRVRELEQRANGGQPPPSRDRSRSVDSLSDLTNIDLELDPRHLDKDRICEEYEDLRCRFEKAVVEIRAMKRELRESQAQTDWLELALISTRQELRGRTEQADSQVALMAARIQDLALKLSNAEKQIRMLKQKLTKTETREKRRSLSLKGRESFTICKELEEKLAELEGKINALDSSRTIAAPEVVPQPPSPGREKKGSIAARLRRKSLDSATSSEPMKVLIRLSSLEAKVAKATKEIIVCPASPNGQSEAENRRGPDVELKLFSGKDEVDNSLEVMNEVKKMESLLRAKLIELGKKREVLVESGQWTREVRFSLLAEKLAYESVLIGRLHDSITGVNSSDVSDAQRLMSGLDAKLSNGRTNTETSLDYMVRALARHLTEECSRRSMVRRPKERRKTDSPIVTDILRKKKALDCKVDEYLNSVVEQLAGVFAMETLGDESGIDRNSSRIQVAWSLAQEAVNQELIQAEISQVVNQCSSVYNNVVDAEKESRFVGLMKERGDLEHWAALANEMLSDEMERAVKRLHDRYQEQLVRLKGDNRLVKRPNEEEEKWARELLQRLVDIVAHKSLLEARVAVITSGESGGEAWTVYNEANVTAEIQYEYMRLSCELSEEGQLEDRVKAAVEGLNGEVKGLCDCAVEAARKLRLHPEGVVACGDKGVELRWESGPAWLEDVCTKCTQLREQLCQLQRFVAVQLECQRCYYLQGELARRETEHDEELRALESKQSQETARLEHELEQQRRNLVCQHEQEQAMLKERARKLERRLGTLDSEYTQQMDNLRAAYHKTLAAQSGLDLHGEENVTQRYQVEIEQLRALCEKGLVGMENSHRRIIAELEEKHRQELEALRGEKEQALAEETQATLAALDAMRKAHEAEVLKEIAKFKTEFLKKMQSTHDIGCLHKEHEAEMEEIKKEILSLSEKYSVKCVESASLEEELRSANNQLAQAQQHIAQLDSRNKQLRAHLVAEVSDVTTESQLLRQRERELEERGKEVGKLQDQLATHAEALSALSVHLRNNDLPDNRVVAALLDKLKLAVRNHYNSTGHPTPAATPPALVNRRDTQPRLKGPAQSPSPHTKQDLKRCGQSVVFAISPCPLSGMVAERKKIFEP